MLNEGGGVVYVRVVRCASLKYTSRMSARLLFSSGERGYNTDKKLLLLVREHYFRNNVGR